MPETQMFLLWPGDIREYCGAATLEIVKKIKRKKRLEVVIMAPRYTCYNSKYILAHI